MKRGRDDGDILRMNTSRKKTTPSENTEKDKKKKNKKKNTGSEDRKSQHGNKMPVTEVVCDIDVDRLTPSELSRYSSWKKTVLPRKDVLDMVSPYSKMDFGSIHLSVVSSCAKMFLGELIEDAVKNKDSPRILTPEDIKAASSRLFFARRNVLPDYSPLIKRKLYRIEKPKPEDLEDEIPFWAH